MYIIIASVTGSKEMPNDEIKKQMEAQMIETFYDSAEDVQREKDSGFLLYENGQWNQYIETF